jgi:hypothetical protein
MNKLILTIIVLMMTMSVTASAIAVTCTSSSLTTNSVKIDCITNTSGNSAQAWISYGGYSNAYKFMSGYQTITGNFTKTISGIPLMAGSKYYYKGYVTLSGVTSQSVEGNFTIPVVTATVNYNFDSHTEELAYSDLNISTMVTVIPKAYTDIIGSIFWGILFALIFVMIWLRQEDVTVPAILGLLIGASLWGLMPEEWVSIAYSLIIVSFAGLMYSLIKSKS